MSPGSGCKLQVYKGLFLPRFTGLELRKRGKTTDWVSHWGTGSPLRSRSPAALRQSLAGLSTALCLLAQTGGLCMDITGARAPGSGHTLSCGWRAEQHSFWAFIVQVSSFPRAKMKYRDGASGKQNCIHLFFVSSYSYFPASIFFFFITFCLSWCMFCCCMKGPKQGHEHCLGIKWWILIWFTAAEKLVKEKWLTACGIYTCTSKTQQICSPSS